MSQIYSPSTPIRETRTLSVYPVKGPVISAGSSYTLFSATGAGNVDPAGNSAPFNNYAPYMTISITVDGGTTQTIPLGLFFLLYGYSTSDGADAVADEFVTKYLGIPVAVANNSVNASVVGVYRRIYIKYNTSCTIILNSLPTQTQAINIYSQVDYYPGVAPAGLYPATRNVIHFAVNDWATSTIAELGVLNILPTVTGVGELESIYFVSSAPVGGIANAHWLESDATTITVDGTTYRYYGTEDFYGNQFYGSQGIHAKTDEYGLARGYAAGSPDGRTYWTGYRYFKETPMLFNSSIGMTWQNIYHTVGTPATQVGSLATYYTVS